jgi:bile acid-coenzyme A ligase
MHVGSMLGALTAGAPDTPLLTVGTATLTRAEVNQAANRLARHYASLGVGCESRVAVALPNGVEIFQVLHAVWKLGAVPVPLSPRSTSSELALLLDLIDPHLVVGVDAGPGRAWLPAGHQPPANLDGSDLPEPPPMSMWKMAVSGGSTGLPKLIVPAQGSDLSLAAVDRLRMQPDQSQLVVGPLYHASPFNWSVFGSMTGQRLVVLERFDVDAALRAIEEHQISWVCLVPTMMHRLVRRIDELAEQGVRVDLSSLETVWHMAAPCPPWLKRRWLDLVGPEVLMELYGTTEGLALTAISGPEWIEHPGSVGRPFQGEVMVGDEHGDPLPVGSTGLVYMRNPSAPRTYRYVGAESVQTSDAWQTMGDRGHLDEDGYLYLADRVTDMVLVGGTNVYPAETEAALLEFPGVLSCAVVGLPDDDLGNRLHAVVQTATGDLDVVALTSHLRDRLVAVKVPRTFRVVDHALRDDAGKLRRGAIRAQELEFLGAATADR